MLVLLMLCTNYLKMNLFQKGAGVLTQNKKKSKKKCEDLPPEEHSLIISCVNADRNHVRVILFPEFHLFRFTGLLSEN